MKKKQTSSYQPPYIREIMKIFEEIHGPRIQRDRIRKAEAAVRKLYSDKPLSPVDKGLLGWAVAEVKKVHARPKPRKRPASD